MKWLTAYIGSIDDAINIINQFGWGAFVTQANGIWHVSTGNQGKEMSRRKELSALDKKLKRKERKWKDREIIKEYFKGKVVIVLGSAPGKEDQPNLGSEIVEGLAAAGATVYSCDIRDEIHRHAEQINANEAYPGQVIPWGIDISDSEALVNLFDVVIEENGVVHCVINSVATMMIKTIASATFGEIDKVIDADVKGPVYLLNIATNYAKKMDTIIDFIDILTVATGYPQGEVLLYSPSKTFRDMLTRLSKLETDFVRIIRVYLGAIFTRIVEEIEVPSHLDRDRYMEGSPVEFRPADEAARRILVGTAKRKRKIRYPWYVRYAMLFTSLTERTDRMVGRITLKSPRGDERYLPESDDFKSMFFPEPDASVDDLS